MTRNWRDVSAARVCKIVSGLGLEIGPLFRQPGNKIAEPVDNKMSNLPHQQRNRLSQHPRTALLTKTSLSWGTKVAAPHVWAENRPTDLGCVSLPGWWNGSLWMDSILITSWRCIHMSYVVLLQIQSSRCEIVLKFQVSSSLQDLQDWLKLKLIFRMHLFFIDIQVTVHFWEQQMYGMTCDKCSLSLYDLTVCQPTPTVVNICTDTLQIQDQVRWPRCSCR